MPMTIKIGSGAYELIVHTPKGKSTYDLSKMSNVQWEKAREMIVNFWCREAGLKELYDE